MKGPSHFQLQEIFVHPYGSITQGIPTLLDMSDVDVSDPIIFFPTHVSNRIIFFQDTA